MADSSLAIVGGGIAGMAASLGLARIGRESLVLERASKFEESGAGIQLTPNAIRALQWLGAWEAVEPHCISPPAIVVRDGQSGALLQRIDLGGEFKQMYGAPYKVAMRAGLLKGLLDATHAKRCITLRTGAEIADVSIADTTLTLISGERVKPKAIIGADGARSLIRRRLQKHDAPPTSEHLHFRSLIDAKRISDVDVENVTLWLSPGAHLVHYPVPGGKLNLVASISQNTAQASPVFYNSCNDLQKIVLAAHEWSKWPALAHASDSNWHENTTALIGDAAHASLPYLAQGAAMALEDACDLAYVMSRESNYPIAFAAFTKRRYPRTSRLQAVAERSGRIYHASGLTRLGRNLVLAASSRQQFLNRMSWIYQWTPEGIT
jgi:salicylate hydroxylase